VGAGPVADGLAQHGTDRSGIKAMTICRYPLSSEAAERSVTFEATLGMALLSAFDNLAANVADFARVSVFPRTEKTCADS
jgi:hypothetical protein